jgi:hypothetical protein
MSKDFWAGPHERGWQVKGSGNSRATSVHETQAEAWAAARTHARDKSGEAFLQGRNGRIRERNTYGQDPKSTPG